MTWPVSFTPPMLDYRPAGVFRDAVVQVGHGVDGGIHDLTTTIPTRTRLAALRRRLPPAYAPSIFVLGPERA